MTTKLLSNYEHITFYYKKNYPSVYDLQFLQQSMFVIPVAFGKEHKRMLAHTKSIVESNGKGLSIHPRFNKLITSLRTAVENGEDALDEETTFT